MQTAWCASFEEPLGHSSKNVDKLQTVHMYMCKK